MIIQVLLIFGLLGLVIYAISQRRRSLFLSNVIVGVSVLGAVFVLFPELTGIFANALGVGRGADLILYCFVIITFAAIFNIHLRLRSAFEITTELTRLLALQTASKPDAPVDRSRPCCSE